MISVSDGHITKAETSVDATARVQKDFNSESLHTSLQKGILSRISGLTGEEFRRVLLRGVCPLCATRWPCFRCRVLP